MCVSSFNLFTLRKQLFFGQNTYPQIYHHIRIKIIIPKNYKNYNIVKCFLELKDIMTSLNMWFLVCQFFLKMTFGWHLWLLVGFFVIAKKVSIIMQKRIIMERLYCLQILYFRLLVSMTYTVYKKLGFCHLAEPVFVSQIWYLLTRFYFMLIRFIFGHFIKAYEG